MKDRSAKELEEAKFLLTTFEVTEYVKECYIAEHISVDIAQPDPCTIGTLMIPLSTFGNFKVLNGRTRKSKRPILRLFSASLRFLPGKHMGYFIGLTAGGPQSSQKSAHSDRCLCLSFISNVMERTEREKSGPWSCHRSHQRTRGL